MSEMTFDGQQIRSLLTELGEELHKNGICAEMFVVGGAAMALVYNSRRATRDVDAVFEPKNTVYEAASKVGKKHGLDDGWLNDSVKGLLPGIDPDQRSYFSSNGISVSVPSPRYLLALKVAAARVDRDADDIRKLAEICGLSDIDGILGVTEEVMGDRFRLLPKAQFLIEEMFPSNKLDP